MYETGLLVAFCLWLFHAVLLVVQLNSTLNKNLRTIGQSLSWLTLTPQPLSYPEWPATALGRVAKYIAIQVCALPFVLLSWASVALALGTFIYRRSKDAGKPQAIRELQWKMRNIEMSFDQLTQEIAKARELTEEELQQFRFNLREEMHSAKH